jgi:AGCS family alanine or glycine:cation symporter
MQYLNVIYDWVSGAPLVVLLVGTGLFLTVRLRFIQVTALFHALRLAFSSEDKESEGDISHFKALMTALAATIGTGNIAGVATAIVAGGPGALFWMWVTAAVGMATKYSEAILAVRYRVVDEKGEMCGGPMYALERGLGQKWLGTLFAVFGAVAAFGIGNMVQSHSVADALHESLSIPYLATGLVLAVLTAAVVLGGIKRIGEVSAYLVPVMAAIYVIGALVILILNYAKLPEAFRLIFYHAFNPTAATGGFAGAVVKETIRWGIRRGLFSNESGLGSAPIAAAAAKTKNPKRQALVSMTGTFLDTIVVCSMTGLVIICMDLWDSGVNGAPLTVASFRAGLYGAMGDLVVSVGLVLFAFSTILGWAYYGEKCIEYLFGVGIVFPYRLLWVVVVLAGGSFGKIDFVWTFADIMNALMAFPNLICLLLLSGVIVAETRRWRED